MKYNVFHCPQNDTIRHRLSKDTDFSTSCTKMDNNPSKLQMGVLCANFFSACSDDLLEKTADFVGGWL